ncbi:glycosyltransferase [Microcoleus sp. F8-D3]
MKRAFLPISPSPPIPIGPSTENETALEGLDYVGSVPQPELVRQMRSVAVLAYPNTYLETSSIAVMEAMACGCRIVASELAALPETTAAFARLV